MIGESLGGVADCVFGCGRHAPVGVYRGDGPGIVVPLENVLVENGDLVAEPGVGHFVERAAFGQELLPAAAR